MKNFIKPDLDLYFNAMPLIGHWLKYDYNKTKNENELINLMHLWFNRFENENTNPDAKKWYYASATYLYSFLTGQTFESKKLI